MSRRTTSVLLSIASLVMLGFAQNAANMNQGPGQSDLLPDEDGGQVRVVRADSGASTVAGKETATIGGAAAGEHVLWRRVGGGVHSHARGATHESADVRGKREAARDVEVGRARGGFTQFVH